MKNYRTMTNEELKEAITLFAATNNVSGTNILREEQMKRVLMTK